MWLDRVIRAAELRDRVKGKRRRSIHSLSGSIINAKSRGVNPIIAELKRASPSGFSSNLNAHKYVKFVESAGAAALSVITEPVAFNGSYSLLRSISSEVNIPVLMKDFTVTEGQVQDAYVLGADAVLLIVRVINDGDRLKDLYSMAQSMGMESIVEVHSEDDLELALDLKPRIIGVNARNLQTLKMNFELQERILSAIPGNVLRVAESGIESVERINRLKELGADGFLIGTSLMKNPEMIFKYLHE
jgi:indole-3-glycerol phosphate synthase